MFDKGQHYLWDRLVYPAEAAGRLGVTVETLRRWHSRGGGPEVAAATSGRLVYWLSALEDWQDRLGAPVSAA